MALIESRKVTNNLVLAILDTFEDTTTDRTTQEISDQIKKVTGHTVKNKFVDDFIKGLGFRVSAVFNALVLEVSSTVMASVYTSAWLKGMIAKAWSFVSKYGKKITGLATKVASKKFKIVKGMLRGKSADVEVMERMSSELKTISIDNRVTGIFQNTSKVADNFKGSIKISRDLNGDAQVPLGNVLSKQVLKLINMQSIKAF